MAIGVAVGAVAGMCVSPPLASTAPASSHGRISVDTVPVPLNSQDASVTVLGDFRYAGGVTLRSSRTTLLHELSDLIMTGSDRFAAVGDQGVLFEGRFVFDEGGSLAGVADTTITRLIGEDGKPLTRATGDAEGLAQLPNGDRLVSFERRPRILLYPRSGGRPREVPSPAVAFAPNAGMEALTTDPEAGADAYMVGAEGSGEIWTCRLTAPCVKSSAIEKPDGFGLVSLNRLPGGITACLLRAYEPIPGVHVIVEILRGSTVIARMDLAPPLTVDNFEGMTSVLRADGRRRFFLISDDNHSPVQRTLLLAFDWTAH
jgi:hypothetical protein